MLYPFNYLCWITDFLSDYKISVKNYHKTNIYHVKMYYSMQCLPEGFVSKNLIVAAKIHPNILS